jgi:16S rRNA (adenine1518-N6/adenine1519-N6)-dimethyltransferase
MSAPVHPRAALARWGLRPQKRFGQNFLLDPSIADQVASLCAVPGGRSRVLEIGAGTGVLTRALLRHGFCVSALEIDRGLTALLHDDAGLSGAELLEADALNFDYAAWAGGASWIAAGNLPYNVATPLIVQLAEMPAGPVAIIAMVQKDVAERLAASPATAAYGSLSVAVQYAMRVDIAFVLPPRAFYPAPKVDSAVVRMMRLPQPTVHPQDPALFRKVVRAAFAYRRKTLVNSLALALHRPHAAVAAAVEASGISAEQRGERLSLNDFARLADALAGE